MQSLDILQRLAGDGVAGDSVALDDPLLQLASEGDAGALMEHMGIPYPENPYEYVGMEYPVGEYVGDELTRKLIGNSAQILTQDQLGALASALGVDNKDPMLDPMRQPQFDIMSLLGGR